MSDSGKYESQDLEDYEVLDGSDTLDGNPGDDPLDAGVVAPGRQTAGMKYALEGEEESESLDELLAEEEPDETAEDEEESWDGTRPARTSPACGGTTTPTPGPGGWPTEVSTTTATSPTTRTGSLSPGTRASTAAGRPRRKRRFTSSTTPRTISPGSFRLDSFRPDSFRSARGGSPRS
jgi:hypothetical protein